MIEVMQAIMDLLVEQFGTGIGRIQWSLSEEATELLNGHEPEVRQGLALVVKVQGIWLQTAASAIATGGVGTIPAKEDTDVHLV